MNQRTHLALVACLAAGLVLSGCGKKEDTDVQAEKKDMAAGIPAPGIAEVKAIAEEGFVYWPADRHELRRHVDGTWKPPALAVAD